MYNKEWPKPKQEDKEQKLVGVQNSPDGTKDFSRAAYVIEDANEKREGEDKQQEDVIAGRIKAQIEANPDKTVIVEKARKYWEKIYDAPGRDGKPNYNRAELQMNEVYAQKYEGYAKVAQEKMLKLESDTNNVKSEEERQRLLVEIVKQRDFIQEMKQEATSKRNSFQPIN